MTAAACSSPVSCQRSAADGRNLRQQILSLTMNDERLTMNDERKEGRAMLNLIDVEPLFWIGMGAVAVVICLMQIVCWSQAPKAQRHG